MLKVVIFGAGLAHYSIKRFLNYENVEIVAYIDNNKTKIGRQLEEVEIFPPSELTSLVYDYIIISSNGAYRAISQQLLELGVKKENIIQAYNFMSNFPNYFFYNDELVRDENMQKIFINNYSFRLSGWET